MSFLSKILRRDVSAPKSVMGDATEKADRLLSQGCYCGALWWSAKALEALPSSVGAVTTLERALANVIAISARAAPQAKLDAMRSRLVARRMSITEAEEAADWTIKLFFSNRMLQASQALLEHKTGGVLGETELRQARELAAAFIHEEGCQGAGHAQWSSVLNPGNVEHTESSIRRERDALARMYRINSESDFLEACTDFANLYAEDHPDFAAMFRCLPQQGLDMPFDTFRNKLEQIFAKNAGDLMLLLVMSRKPE